MGANTSKEKIGNNDNNPICIDCAKETQVDVPDDDMTTLGVCAKQYETVNNCMKLNNGQITSCKDEWQAFQLCHSANKS
jgi:hypothetical protein